MWRKTNYDENASLCSNGIIKYSTGVPKPTGPNITTSSTVGIEMANTLQLLFTSENKTLVLIQWKNALKHYTNTVTVSFKIQRLF